LLQSYEITTLIHNPEGEKVFFFSKQDNPAIDIGRRYSVVDVPRVQVGGCQAGVAERYVLDVDAPQFPLWHFGSGVPCPALEAGLGAIG
jgi:hypothetical protein